jgi:chromate transporter
VKQILSIITAAVVGVVLNLTVYLGEAVILTEGSFEISKVNFTNLAWVFVSVIAMKKFNIGMIKWIGCSAVFGLLMYFLQGI